MVAAVRSAPCFASAVITPARLAPAANIAAVRPRVDSLALRSAPAQSALHSVDVAGCGRQHQRRRAVRRLAVDVGAGLE